MLFRTKMTLTEKRGNRPAEIIERDLNFPDLSIETFRQRLVETITWCSPRLDYNHPETCFRSEELAVDELVLEFDNVPEHMASVISRREALLQGTPLFQLTNEIFSLGRILVFFPYDSLYEGAVAQECRNYIGANEFPPWDTWICVGQGSEVVLFCWVPAVFVNEVTEAFLVMTSDWLAWVVAADEPLV